MPLSLIITIKIPFPIDLHQWTNDNDNDHMNVNLLYNWSSCVLSLLIGNLIRLTIRGYFIKDGDKCKD